MLRHHKPGVVPIFWESYDFISVEILRSDISLICAFSSFILAISWHTNRFNFFIYKQYCVLNDAFQRIRDAPSA
jgi:hypothetical protein